MSPTLNFVLQIRGVVQSVGFRPFIKNLADEFDLKGYIQNQSSAGVEIAVQSTPEILDKFIIAIKEKKPILSEIFEINVQERNNGIQYNDFTIKESQTSSTRNNFSTLPPDIAICDNCIDDIQTSGRRYKYPFTSCTDCGPRYTAIIQIPYDRMNTTFGKFPLCPKCKEEYQNSKNRRFHAETTCCPNCGPSYSLYKVENFAQIDLSWEKVHDFLSHGKIISVKGVGGSHFIADAQNKSSVRKLREKRRKNSLKPFAVMVYDKLTLDKYFDYTQCEYDILNSYRKPIVILKAKDPELWENVSGGLSTVGVMMPYSGLHSLLFSNEIKVLVMTSANLPGIPMPIELSTIHESSIQVADYVLTHSLEIYQRNDDSVLRMIDKSPKIIRRSRGYTPQAFFVEDLTKADPIHAVGGEENLTIAYLANGWIIPSQYIGNLKNLETLDYMKSVIQHLENLYGIQPSEILSDLHPEFLSTGYAIERSEILDINHFQIQHHVAHAASLALDNNLGMDSSSLTWVADGYGYGIDGSAWGSELILLQDGTYKRLATSIPVDYTGGDQNAKFPGRMLLKYLQASNIDSDKFFLPKVDKYFKRGKLEYEHLKIPQTTEIPHQTHAMGRYLDAISSMLGLCYQRTFQGEPAIKLEDLVLRYPKNVSIGSIDEYITHYKGLPAIDFPAIVSDLYHEYNENNRIDIAHKGFKIISKSLFELGNTIAQNLGISNLGFSGGVAYNEVITRDLFELSKCGIPLITHNRIPPGDGGLSSGQIYYRGMMNYYGKSN